MTTMPPCKDCTDRHEACHDTCQKYKDWKWELKLEKDKMERFKKTSYLRFKYDFPRVVRKKRR